MTDFFNLLRLRRSIRDYENRALSLNLIKQIIRDSCQAPSSSNGRPWRFIVVNNREMMKRISDNSKQTLLQVLDADPEARFKKYESALRNKDFNVFYNAPSLVMIVGQADCHSIQVDCSLAASYFMFSAAARGLGTCWIGLGRHVTDPALREEIGLPSDHIIVAPIIVGYPKQTPPVPQRDPEILKIIS